MVVYTFLEFHLNVDFANRFFSQPQLFADLLSEFSRAYKPDVAASHKKLQPQYWMNFYLVLTKLLDL